MAVLPDALDILVTPTIALLVSGLAMIDGLMFIAGQISTWIGESANGLLETSGILAGFVLGGAFLPLVMLGLHQALIPIHATLIEQYGYTSLLPILAMAGAGQVGAAAAVYLRLGADPPGHRPGRTGLLDHGLPARPAGRPPGLKLGLLAARRTGPLLRRFEAGAHR